MQVQLSSGNYDIIASNEVFLFKDSDELVFWFEDDDNSRSRIIFRFLKNRSEECRVNVEPENDNDLVITCFNFFSRFGTGLKEPIQIGESMGKGVYIFFTTKQHTSKPPYVRSVQFTLYREQ